MMKIFNFTPLYATFYNIIFYQSLQTSSNLYVHSKSVMGKIFCKTKIIIRYDKTTACELARI